MHEVNKAMMFIYRLHDGKPEFFVRYDGRFDRWLILTGHQEPGETLLETAKRETWEETNADILNIVDLKYSRTVTLAHSKISHEYAFLIQVPDQDYKFLEGEDVHKWFTLEELPGILTYEGQSNAIESISKILNS